MGMPRTIIWISNSINELIASRTPGYAAPSLELDSGINLVRGEGGGVLGEDLQQSLGLRLLYVYAPRHGQSDIPLFDTAVADANVDRLFAWNRFSGGDRINDANFLSYGAAWRIWHPRREREILRWKPRSDIIFIFLKSHWIRRRSRRFAHLAAFICLESVAERELGNRFGI